MRGASVQVMRVLKDGALGGAENMARDEALLTGVGSGVSEPTVRLYGWAAPTISLGYFQRYADYVALPRPAGGLAVVRRLTGGGAILHDLELTYSIALPVNHAWLSGGANRLYELAHDAVIAALGDLKLAASRCGESDDSGAAKGPFFCFSRRHCYDVLVNGDKIAGSAQRRTRGAVLQHGSIILGNRFGQQPTAATDGPFEQTLAQVRRGMVEGLGRATRCALVTGDWHDEEMRSAGALEAKYAGGEWTRRT